MTWWQNTQRHPRNTPKGKQQQNQTKGAQQSKGNGQNATWFPAYDAGHGDKESHGASSGSTSASIDPQLLQVLKQIADSNPEAAEKIHGLLPGQDQQDQQEIKDQQKKINLLRRLQQRIQKKENQIKTKESQMDTFIQQMKDHILREKQRHKEELEELRRDIEQARVDIQKIKNGDTMENQNQMDMDLEEVLDSPTHDEEKIQLKEKLHTAEKANSDMQRQLCSLQQQMAEFMQNYQQRIAPMEVPVGTPPGAFTPEQNVKLPAISLDAAIAAAGMGEAQKEKERPGGRTRDALQPFGIARKDKAQSGPYAPPPPVPKEDGGTSVSPHLNRMDQ